MIVKINKFNLVAGILEERPKSEIIKVLKELYIRQDHGKISDTAQLRRELSLAVGTNLQKIGVMLKELKTKGIIFRENTNYVLVHFLVSDLKQDELEQCLDDKWNFEINKV